MSPRHRWTADEAAKLRQACHGHRDYGDASRAVLDALGWLPSRSQADAALHLYLGMRLGELFRGSVTPREVVHPDDAMRDRLAYLERENKELRDRTLTDDRVRREILGVADVAPDIPSWLVKTAKATKSPGVPTLLLTDFHWGEVVDPNQVGGVNSYDLAIARARLRTVVTTTVDLLKNHMVCPSYPGIVVALGGDMVSGNIHEELTETNEQPIMPTLVDLFGCMIWTLETLTEAFGHVFVPAVTGNHGRTTNRPRAKGRAHTSYDWLLYQLLAKRFADDVRVTFLIPDGPDALFRVYGTRYLLTHGDQFKGGDGLIGPLGPLTRGNHKKASRNSAIGLGYDTMVCGHFHQLMQLQRLIVGGSLKGLDEYAFALNVSYEPPQQALWITHPDHGITIRLPVLAERGARKPEASWVSVAA